MLHTLKTTIFACLFASSCFAYSIKDLSVEEKVGQLLIAHFNGEIANQDAKSLVQDVHVGGIIYYNWANTLSSPQQVRNLSIELQQLAKANSHPIPLFIAVDQEGGVVARLTQGFTVFPGNKALAMTNDSQLAEKSAFAIGNELKAVGVNMNFSPVVDINCNPRNPVIGVRSFGEFPHVVLEFAKQAIAGYHKAGIITCLKHYPGHGDVGVDSHEDLPVVKKTKDQLWHNELLPFLQLASEADTIMTAHIMLPDLDAKNCATLSKTILDIVRNEMGFNRPIISDSLIMEGVVKKCASIDDAAIRAINAGCDILILGGKQLVGSNANFELTVADVKRIHKSLVSAVQNGQISEKRLNQAVERILALKNSYSLSTEPSSTDLSSVNSKANQLLAKTIASLAIKTIENKSLSATTLEQSHIVLFAPVVVKDTINQTTLPQLGLDTRCLFFNQLNPSEDEIKAAAELAKKADLILFCSYNAWKNSAQAALIDILLNSDKPMALIALRDPLDAYLFPKADIVISTFSPTAPSIEAAANRLLEK